AECGRQYRHGTSQPCDENSSTEKNPSLARKVFGLCTSFLRLKNQNRGRCYLQNPKSCSRCHQNKHLRNPYVAGLTCKMTLNEPDSSYHCYMMGNLRLVLAVEVAPGNQHTSKHSSPRLWEYLDGLSAELRPWLIRG